MNARKILQNSWRYLDKGDGDETGVIDPAEDEGVMIAKEEAFYALEEAEIKANERKILSRRL